MLCHIHNKEVRHLSCINALRSWQMLEVQKSWGVLTFLHCSKSGGKNKAPVVHYTLVGPRKWSVECCYIPVVCIYGDVSRPSGVDNAVVVAPVDVWPPTTDNVFHSLHFTREANGLHTTCIAILWLHQQNWWVWSNVVRSLWFPAFYRICRSIFLYLFTKYTHARAYIN